MLSALLSWYAPIMNLAAISRKHPTIVLLYLDDGNENIGTDVEEVEPRVVIDAKTVDDASNFELVIPVSGTLLIATLNAHEPPQICDALPEHGESQIPAGESSRVLPQKHSMPYSVPEYL